MTRIPAHRSLAGLALAALAASTPAAPRVVPWLAQPAPAAAPAAAPAPATRACAASDFRIGAGGAGAWHGFATQELRLARIGEERCRVDAAPAIELVSPGGLRQAVDAGADAAAVRAGFDVGPRDTLLALVGTPGACDATVGPERRVHTRLRVALGGGGEAFVEGAHVDTVCGPARLLALQAVDTEPEAARAAWSGLRASLGEIGPAVAGGELRYVVTLANPGAQPIELADCPAYTQTVSVEDRASRTRWRLACEAAGGRIAPRSSVAFEMRVPVPATMTGAGLKLGWALEDGPAAGAIMPLR